MIAGTALMTSDDTLRDCIQTQIQSVHATPDRLFFSSLARSNVAYVRERCKAPLTPAISVKTNPRREMLRYAFETGFLAEVISHDELSLAASCGFPAERVIYNGPRPLERGRVLVAFADSVEAMKRYCHEGRSRVAGVRYRPGHIDSRFGVLEDDLEQCAAIAAECDMESVGLQFHVRPEDYGERSWSNIAGEALEAAKRFETLSGKPLTHFDVGGGWTPEALEHALGATLPRFAATAVSELHHVQSLIIEPGQGIATPVEAVVTRVLEVRNRWGYSEAIVDTGYPDLPQIRTYAHRIFHVSGNCVNVLPFGRDHVAGSTCLEYDILSDSVRVDGVVNPGDLLVVADAGAYDASMSFAFAHGQRYEAG